MTDLRIVMVTGHEVIFRDAAAADRNRIERTMGSGESLRVVSDGHAVVLNPAHIVMVADVRDEAPTEEAPTVVARDLGDNCPACRGRGTITRIENRIKVMRTCENCLGSGKAPTWGVQCPD